MRISQLKYSFASSVNRDKELSTTTSQTNFDDFFIFNSLQFSCMYERYFLFYTGSTKSNLIPSHLVTYVANINTASATQTGKITKLLRLQVMFNPSSKGKYVPRVFLKTFLALCNTERDLYLHCT